MRWSNLLGGIIYTWFLFFSAYSQAGLSKPKHIPMKGTNEPVNKGKKNIEIALPVLPSAEVKLACKIAFKPIDLSDDQINKWIQGLDNDDFAIREHGQACLSKYLATNASQIHTQIAATLKKGVQAEQKYRLERLMKNLGEEISCTLSRSKLVFYSGTEKLPGLLKKMTNPKEVGSQDLPPMKLGKCVSPDLAMRLTEFEWAEMKDPWGMTVARELASVVLPDSKLGIPVPAWLADVDRYRFLPSRNGEFRAECSSKPGSKCALEAPPSGKNAPSYQCRYSCLCGDEKAVDHYEVSALVHNAIVGAANLRNFEDEQLCPQICKAEGKEPAPSSVWVPISSASEPCIENTAEVTDYRKFAVDYSLAGKFAEDKNREGEKHDEESGLQFQKQLKRVPDPSH